MKTLRSRYARRVLVPVMAASLLSACTYWKVQEMAPSQVVSEKEPDRVRLTMVDSTRIELSEPQVVGSDILGRWDRGQIYYGADPAPRRIPIDSVSYAETRNTAIVDTVLLGILGATVVAFALLVACGAGGGCSPGGY